MPHMGFHPDDNITSREPGLHGDPTSPNLMGPYWQFPELFVQQISLLTP